MTHHRPLIATSPAGCLARWAAAIGCVLALTACATATGRSSAPAPATATGAEAAVEASSAATDPALPEMTAAPLPACTGGALPTVSTGTLTVAAPSDLREPWFTGDHPATADGYEAQIVRRVAQTLGYPAERISWLRVDPAEALSGSASASFDVFVGEARATPDAAEVVDFSSGYYSITDAVVVPRGTPKPARPVDLGRVAVGAAQVAPGAPALEELTRVGAVLQAGDSADAAIDALAGAADAAIVPTPDAIAAAQDDPGVVVAGQLQAGKFQPDQFSLVLAKGSALTPCVSAAVDRLRIEGQLDELTATYVTPLAPELTF